ncbi:Sec-independent protein translocase subunit TatA [Modestobacter sp. I12A-02628]|uniref:Sec-independent protein translocase protein TatA n=1 Tax=Goekera deserti TaxID=2497753 RepID=A0A7K3WE03_9ACTN|nr:Sec-independent protein translocase subunit TatA [Goekera deserti]MPQ99647.1 Sec-independent protein translocase subunit TatA [Goekera deserti]NDI46343.1 Sec-independent protein translocase subunit TatA [Goekera deserti]NEL54725.1 Sec-independent protein translocase subunit TatA [Goekera deserti]
MGSLGAPEIILIILAIMLLFGYKKLPEASRSMGRSLRIFKGEMKGMKDDDVSTKDAAATTPVRGQIVSPAQPVATPDYEAEARAAEARAAEARARADAARSSTPVDGTR